VNAVHTNVLEKVEKDVKWLRTKFEKDRAQKLALRDKSKSGEIIAQLQKEGGLQKLTVQFLKYVEEKRLMAELTNMLNNFLSMCMDYRKESEVQITLPKNFSSKEEKILVNVLQQLYLPKDTKPVIVKTVDEKMAGFVAQVAGVSIDASLKTSLQQRDRQVNEWISSLRGGLEDVNEQMPKSKPWLRPIMENALKVVSDKAKANPSDKQAQNVLQRLTGLFNRLKENNAFKDQTSLHVVMEDMLSLVHAKNTMSEAPAVKWSKPGAKVTPESAADYISRRVKTNPESEGWMYEVKMRNWKDIMNSMSEKDPWRNSYAEAIKLVEPKCGVVPFTPPDPSLDPHSFHNLKKMSIEELIKVPVEVFQSLSSEQLSQLKLAENKNKVLELLNYEEVDTDSVRKMDIATMEPVDVDVVCMSINDELRVLLNAKRFALQRYFNETKGGVKGPESDEFIRTWDSKPVTELNQKFKLKLNTNLDQRLSELFRAKEDVEKKVKARGMTPIPDRLQW
jgi:F0F1-type ATP synthase delta subunit